MPLGSYIKDLQKADAAKQSIIHLAHDRMIDLIVYLESDKFKTDTTVQVQQEFSLRHYSHYLSFNNLVLDF